MLKELGHNHPNLELKLNYSNELLSVAHRDGLKSIFLYCLPGKGQCPYQIKVTCTLAIENYLKAGDIALDENTIQFGNDLCIRWWRTY